MTTSSLTDTQIDALLAAGGRRWTKGSHDRIYLSPMSVAGYSVERYGTGNIAAARDADGNKISNSEAARLGATKAFVDVSTGRLHIEGASGRTVDTFVDAVKRGVERVLSA